MEVSYTNDQLVQNTKMCLEKRSAVGIVILAKIQEMPEYHCPTFKLSDLAFTEQGFTRTTKVEGQNCILQGAYRLALYKDYIWVEEISGYPEM